MRVRFLVLVTALLLSLSWVPTVANAGDIGQCNSILASAAGPVGQINQGINVAENCNEVLNASLEFVGAGCDLLPAGSLLIDKLGGQALDRVCAAVVDVCGIPVGQCL